MSQIPTEFIEEVNALDNIMSTASLQCPICHNGSLKNTFDDLDERYEPDNRFTRTESFFCNHCRKVICVTDVYTRLPERDVFVLE